MLMDIFDRPDYFASQEDGAKELVHTYMRDNQEKLINDALRNRKRYKGNGVKPIPTK